MIYCFKVTTQESPEFLLEMELDGHHSFFYLHQAIQRTVGFQPHQLASFFTLDKIFKKRIEVSLIDFGINGAAFLNMQKTRISDLVNRKGQKLIYTFDLINDRSLMIELTDIIMEKNLNETHVALFRGDAPVQVLDDVLEQETEVAVSDPVYHDYGILDDYAQIFGEMDEF